MILTSLVNKLWKPIVVLGFAAKLLFSDPSYAQETGTINGTVLNQLSNPVIVNVKAEQVEDRDTYFSTITDENGKYSFSSVPVPVELMSFTGEYNVGDNNLILEWITATETNNYGFDIEQLIENEWKKIGFVQGNGTTNEEIDYSFLINNINLESGNHSFRLEQIDLDGKTEYSPVLNINIPKPDKAEIGNISPNPGSIINIPFKINESNNIEIKVYNLLGQEVKHLINEEKQSGYYSVIWDGTNNFGSKVSSGIYFITMKAPGINKVKKMVYMQNSDIANAFVDESMFKNSNEVLNFEAEIEKLNKSNASGVVYDFIFSGNNIIPDTLKKFLIKGDTTINHLVTQIINIEANVKDNYSNNNPTKENVPEAELVYNELSKITDSDGNTTLRIPINETSTYEIKIKKNNFFTRTASISSTEDNYTLNEEIVPYPISVSADTFRAFCEEANFATCGQGYLGLKTMFGNPNAQYWISSHGDAATYAEGGVATAEEQTYVKNLIENEIYLNIKEENRPTIYVENPDSLETIPATQDGISAIIPRNHPTFGIVTQDNDSDGITDWNVIYYPNGQWNESYKKRILEEALSALIGPGEVTKFSGLTALQANGVITEIDKMLIRICEFYKPKTQIDNILKIE